MTERKEIGKIKAVQFGLGGYQGAQTGISFSLGGKGWGVGDFWGNWTTRPDHAQYSVKEWRYSNSDMVRRISSLLKDSGVSNVTDLEGVPIEVIFAGCALKEWRVLTEVL